jgi:glucose uptake protein GlcU
MSNQTKIAFLYIMLATVFNGTYLLPYKSMYIQSLHIGPLMYLLYTSMGIFFMHWLLLALLPINSTFVTNGSNDFHFASLGLISGLLLVMGMTANYYSIKKIGLARAQGVIAGSSTITGYIIGKYIFNENTRDRDMSIAALIVIVISVIAIAQTKTVAKLFCIQPTNPEVPNAIGWSPYVYNQPLHPGETKSTAAEEVKSPSELEQGLLQNITKVALTITDWILGSSTAIIAGIVLGTVWVPLHYVPNRETGFNYLPAFSVGMIMITPIMAIAETAASIRELAAFNFGKAMKYGIASGIIWSLGNMFTVGGLSELSYSETIPLLQCASIIQGLWGILFYGELSDVSGARATFIFFSISLIIGVVLLVVAED